MDMYSFLDDIEHVDPMPILVAPHRALKTVARAVTPNDIGQIKSLLPKMFSAMYRAPGIGLAAPQVGVSLRFILVDVAKEDERDPHVMINPEVISSSETLESREEGCLSLPNQYAEVIRPDRIRVRYKDLNWKMLERDADGLFATCIQHEIDHLNGTLFVDHLSPMKRNMLMRRLVKEQKRG